TEFLGCEYPSHQYPTGPELVQRPVRQAGEVPLESERPTARLGRWARLPWGVAAHHWRGGPLVRSPRPETELVSARFATPVSEDWVLRDDTFPGNLAIFRPSNFEPIGHGAGRLVLKRELTAVREYTSAAVSSAGRYRYGSF